MNSQKLENQLNLALDSTMEEREKSLDLNTGYDPNDNVWQLIIKHTGNLDNLKQLNLHFIELLNNYAILYINQSLIDTITEYENIIYVEKPQRLNFTVQQGKRVSCINELQNVSLGDLGLFGNGVVIAVIDSGIDFRHEVFINEDGTTKILELWDQTLGSGENVPLYNIGTIFTGEDINRALKGASPENIDTRDFSGHGTAVAGICSTIAPESKLLVVKLATPLENSFPRTSELMMAIDYSVRKSLEFNVPLVINLSFGNNYGSHDGTSLLETYIDSVAQVGRTTIVVGTGNEGFSTIHTSGIVTDTPEIVEVGINAFETGLNIQLWKLYNDVFNIEIISPSGDSTGTLVKGLGAYRYILGNTILLIYYGEPSPYSQYQEIYLDFIPKDSYIDSGIWQIVIYGQQIVSGEYDMWLPAEATLNNSGFLRPTPETTLTIPSTSEYVISVGAYNGRTFAYADFSGRGYTRFIQTIKPDLVAPGVDISCPSPGGGYVVRSGTSMATPFVSGGAALLMEWGITRRNDIYLYGEKVKAYLIRGARALEGEDRPSKRTGWGALCVADSLPK